MTARPLRPYIMPREHKDEQFPEAILPREKKQNQSDKAVEETITTAGFEVHHIAFIPFLGTKTESQTTCSAIRRGHYKQ